MGGFQLWVNLPAALKMSQPRYQDLSAAQIPEVRRDDGTVIRVVAGEVDGVGGAVTEIYAEPEYLDVFLPAGAHFTQPVPRGHSALAYAFEGEGLFGVAADLGYRGDLDGVLLTAPQMAVFGDGDVVRVEADGSPVRFLLVSGKPLGEPIARYGPFVMNTREELQLALRDLQNDTFVWREDPEWAGQRRTWSPDTWERCRLESVPAGDRGRASARRQGLDERPRGAAARRLAAVRAERVRSPRCPPRRSPRCPAGPRSRTACIEGHGVGLRPARRQPAEGERRSGAPRAQRLALGAREEPRGESAAPRRRGDGELADVKDRLARGRPGAHAVLPSGDPRIGIVGRRPGA